jgi:hypothetical protein
MIDHFFVKIIFLMIAKTKEKMHGKIVLVMQIKF